MELFTCDVTSWLTPLEGRARRKQQKEKAEEDMAELSLYLTNVNVSLGQTMDTEKVKSFLNIISALE